MSLIATRLQSAIAEILLWFTPNGCGLYFTFISAIAEISLWFTPDSTTMFTITSSAIAEILLWFTPCYIGFVVHDYLQ